MPPKKGTKRKAAAKDAHADQNGDVDLNPPDRATWPGWVEMESEPAFFNVMLKDMGIRGVKIQEIYDLDPDQLAGLAQPVHAFIFCFRYKVTEMTQEETECPLDVWFANQIPEFACASVALLNIVNNVKGLHMGKEMRDFKDFTMDMNPIARGDAIDGFEFLKRIHNSFARETDMLTADMHLLNKINKAKKKQAALQGAATKKAKKAAAAPKTKRADSAVATTAKITKCPAQAATKKTKAKVIFDSDGSSPLSEPPESDQEYEAAGKGKASSSPSNCQATRRSGRQPKPRKDTNKLFSEVEVAEDDEGFHFVAYVPVNDRVWKMDGLDSYPHWVGDFDAEGGGLWTNVAGPDILARMAQFEGIIQYNLMAVVHDPIVEARTRLAANVKELHTIDSKLDAVCKEWRTRDAADTGAEEHATAPDEDLDLVEADLATAAPPPALEKTIAHHQDVCVNELLQLRRQRIKAQAPLRDSIRSELVDSKRDEEKAGLTQHDLGGFVRGWMGALAEQEVLRDLVDENV